MSHSDTNAIRDAALRPLEETGRGYWTLLTVIGLITIWGLVAWGYQIANGLQVTGYSNRVFWGTYETNLVTFIGFSYGGALVSAILRLTGAEWRSPITRLAEATALVALLIGAIFPIIHLGRPERLVEMFYRPNFSSPLMWDLVAVMTYLFATIIFLYLPLIPDFGIARDIYASRGGPSWRVRLYRTLSLGWQDTPAQRRLVEWGTGLMAVMIIPVAVMVHSVLSWAFALSPRDGWHSTIFAPYFVIAALYSGVATVILVVAAFRRAYRLQDFIKSKHFQYLGLIMLTLGVTYLYFTFSEFMTEGYSDTRAAIELLGLMLQYRFAPLFWSFVAAGVVIPVLLVALPKTRTIAGVTTASALVVVSMWLKRFLIVVPAQTLSLMPSPLAAVYKPSWVEWSITTGAAAGIPLLLMLLFRVFPILAIWEMEHVGEAHAAALPSVAGAQAAGIASFEPARGDD